MRTFAAHDNPANLSHSSVFSDTLKQLDKGTKVYAKFN